MRRHPETVRISLSRNKAAGLLAASSPDLPGLLVVAGTMDEIDDRLPAAIAQIVEAQFDVRVRVEAIQASGAGFSPIERVIELAAA